MMEILAAWGREAMGQLALVPPWQLGVAIAVLPLFGVPVSPFLILAGLRAGPLQGLLLAWTGLAINIALGHRLAQGWPRRTLINWLQRRGYQLPQVERADETRLILMTRLVPALPLAAQNYLLGLAGVRFWRYFLLSVPIQCLYAAGFVLLGRSLANSSAWKFATAGGMLVGVSLGVSLVRRRMQRRAAGLGSAPETLPRSP